MIKYIRNYNVNDIFYNKLNPSGGHHYQILVDKDENYQCNVVYNKDLDQPVIVVGWTSLRDFYLLTEDHLVSLIHYDKGWIHLHFEDVAKCPLVFNHLRKTLKIEVR
ncbi:hypothetical protein HKD37_08G020712 [Glycine soja]